MDENLHLLPPLVKNGQTHELLESGQSISASFSSRMHSGAVFVCNTELPTRGVNGAIESSERQPVYFFGRFPPVNPIRRLFILETFDIFEQQRSLIRDAELKNIIWDENEKHWNALRSLCFDYTNVIQKCWKDMSKLEMEPSSQDPFDDEHHQMLFTCFTLFVFMFVPEYSYEDAIVGEHFMKWLNLNFIAPSTEEGDVLSSLDRPWEDDTFWPYLTRATLRGLRKASRFFFQTLANHPSEDLQDLSATAATLVETQPSLNDYNSEKEFLFAAKRWQGKVKALRIEMDRIPEEEREDGTENWWDRLSDIIGILEGQSSIVKRVCMELGGDWKEACAAWAIFVEPGLRRRDLREVAHEILNDLPPDPTDLEDQIHIAAINADFPQILERASQLDPWLAAHMAQVMEPILGNTPPVLENGLTLGQYYVLAYGEYLQGDATFWKQAVHYMYTCGRVGEQQADEVLLRLPLKSSLSASMLEEEQVRSGEVVGIFQEVSEVCARYHREAIRRTVCRIAAQNFVAERLYGLALSYLVSAEDWPGLARVVNRVLAEYVAQGPDSFTEYASQITPSLLDLGKLPHLSGALSHRLSFVVRLAQFHQFRREDRHQDAALELVSMLHQGIVPRAWWPVLLCDSIEYLQGPTLFFSSLEASELLKKLDEVLVHVSQNSGKKELLDILSSVKGSEKEAWQCLKALRLSLARYFALVYQQPS